jgi:hypothetical protein
MRLFLTRWTPGRPNDWGKRLTAFSPHWHDISVGLALMVLAGLGSYIGSGLVEPAINSLEAFDVWFDSDVPRVFDNMVSRFSDHKRADVHPFFALIAFPPVFLLRTIANLDNWTAVRVVIACVASVWVILLYTLLRCVVRHRLHAILFTLVAAVSASAMFWFVVPETMPFGSVTILLALIFVVVASRRTVSPAWAVAVNLLTLSVTITNWAVGLLATFATYTKQQAIRVTAYTVCLAVLLSASQLYLFKRAAPFGVSNRIVAEEPVFFLRGDSGSPSKSTKAFLFHSMVMPQIQRYDHYWSWNKWPMMRVQLSTVGSGTVWAPVSVLLWCALLALGVWAVFTVPTHSSLRFVLCGAILVQLGLHSVFGRETFLYSLHFGPLLVLLAAFGTLTRWRRVSLLLASGLLLTAGLNNALLLRDALAFVRTSRPPTARFQSAIDLSILDGDTPSIPPASVVLSTPQGGVIGSVGPGGSFTPGDNSFVVSLWVVNHNGIVVTSDSHWSPITSQVVAWTPRGAPSVETDNWYYRTIVRGTQHGTWAVDIAQTENLLTRLVVAIRSAGHSLNPIRTLEWDEDCVLVNNRWTVRVTPPPSAVRVGEENPRGHLVSRTNPWEGSDGVGYALLELNRQARTWRLVITDSDTASDSSSPSPSSTRAVSRSTLPHSEARSADAPVPCRQPSRSSPTSKPTAAASARPA